MVPRRPAGGRRRVVVDTADVVGAAAIVCLALQEAAGVGGLPQLGQEVVVGQLLFLGPTCESNTKRACPPSVSQQVV